jgi:hypothetical protein
VQRSDEDEPNEDESELQQQQQPWLDDENVENDTDNERDNNELIKFDDESSGDQVVREESSVDNVEEGHACNNDSEDAGIDGYGVTADESCGDANGVEDNNDGCGEGRYEQRTDGVVAEENAVSGQDEEESENAIEDQEQQEDSSQSANIGGECIESNGDHVENSAAADCDQDENSP